MVPSCHKKVASAKAYKTMNALPTPKVPIKICRECKWFRPSTEHSYHPYLIEHGLCTHPNYQEKNHVTGITSYPKAADIRRVTASGNPGMCGLDGVFWESETAYTIFIRELRTPFLTQMFLNMLCVFIVLSAILTWLKENPSS